MGYSDNPNGSDLPIVTVVLQYSVFATDMLAYKHKGSPCIQSHSVHSNSWLCTNAVHCEPFRCVLCSQRPPSDDMLRISTGIPTVQIDTA